MARVLKEKIASVEKIASDIFKMTLKSEYIALNAAPGQFVNVKCCEGVNALLRRPISICGLDKAERIFDICFQVKGAGTGYLSQKKTGDEIDIIGPLGNPFSMSAEYARIAVVGGGIGAFPLLYVLNESKAVLKSAFLGYRNKDCMALKDGFEHAADRLLVSTDDGSYGRMGLVTELLGEELAQNKYDIIYACGPTPMLKGVVAIAEKHGIRCQVSLEQRMGCGIGACLVCACKTRADTPEGWNYSHVCKDGPVFWSSEIIFE